MAALLQAAAASRLRHDPIRYFQVALFQDGQGGNTQSSGNDKVLCRDVPPFSSATFDFASPSSSDRNAQSASFALPSTGGAATFTRNTRPARGSSSQPSTSLRRAFGTTRTRISMPHNFRHAQRCPPRDAGSGFIRRLSRSPARSRHTRCDCGSIQNSRPRSGSFRFSRPHPRARRCCAPGLRQKRDCRTRVP